MMPAIDRMRHTMRRTSDEPGDQAVLPGGECREGAAVPPCAGQCAALECPVCQLVLVMRDARSQTRPVNNITARTCQRLLAGSMAIAFLVGRLRGGRRCKEAHQEGAQHIGCKVREIRAQAVTTDPCRSRQDRRNIWEA